MLVSRQPVVTSELGDSGSSTVQSIVTSPRYQPCAPSGDAGVTILVITGALESPMLYVSEAEAVRPPASVYKQDAVCDPMPSDAYVPVIALSSAANELGPSSASVTWHVAVGTEPLL